MLVYKCDICKKSIKSGADAVTAGVGDFWKSHILCARCGKPVIEFLKKSGLLKKRE